MTVFRMPGRPAVEVAVRTSSRARRLSLRVSRLDGRVTLTRPTFVRESDWKAFLNDREVWIRDTLGTVPDRVDVAKASRIPIEGRDVRLQRIEGRRLTVLDEGAALGLPQKSPSRTLMAYLKERARHRLSLAVDRHAAGLGHVPAGIRLRDTRSRWGSCSSEGWLMFSWRLIMAPPDVLDYVAAHEVAHLSEMNHSPAFWDAVERLQPGYQAQRAWLRNEGATLHRYRFAD